MKSTFEKMGGTYTLGADGIYYPNLVSTDEEPHYGKYGMMRKTYLKEHRPAMYSLYMLEDRLTEHLNTVDDEAQERMDILVRHMMERQGITEEMKVRDQMEWVRAVNNIRNAAEEIAIMLVAVSIMLISACGKKEKLYEIPDLSQYKTDYVGDSSNVINIVSGQEYPEGYSYDSIEIQSETEPYGLTVFLKDEPSAVKLEDELQVNADMTFDLIGNLGTIDYKTADSKEIIASYER